MSEIVYRILSLIEQVVASVPVGTNLGLLHLLLTLLSGRLLASRGALFPALADLGLPDAAVRRAQAALCYGRWHINQLIAAWRLLVLTEGDWQPRSPEALVSGKRVSYAALCSVRGDFSTVFCLRWAATPLGK